ncbi:hypothetical protein [Streptococcus canis]|uniref:hypothetical protein n=1 Tax=Streptococcus canis TaxID=1329 RepID=UPI0024DED2F9|nr:hypothetical protein [Streptococcus canis]
MKKKLMLVVVLLLSMCTVSVRADEGVANGNLFTTKGQSHLPGVTVAPFKTGDTTISVNLEPYGYVNTTIYHADGTYEKVEAKDKTVTIQCPTRHNCTEKSWSVSGYRAGGDGNYKVELKKQLEEGDSVSLSFADDGNFYFGQLTFESQKSQNERLQKEREAEEQQYAEELFKRSIEEETNKTWYQRWGDSIQDQWWNFKGWLRG